MSGGENKFDAIVIGSGVGGLAVAGILAKLNHKRVLVLEKHFLPGGLTHAFSRGKFKWDVGGHYVGEMGQEKLVRQIFDYLTDGELKWAKMPHVFEKFVYPEFSLEVPSDPQEYRYKLIATFPAESEAICKYFQDIDRTAAWHRLYIIEKSIPRFVSYLFQLFNLRRKRIALSLLKEYLDSHFRDHRLKAILVSQWGDYGVPPQQASFAIHALIVDHYLHGGYFPVGGASRIVKFMKPIIERAGGAILADQEVTGLLVEDGTVQGVETSYPNGSEFGRAAFYAPIVISNIGAVETYEKFLKPFVPMPGEMKYIPAGLSAITVYLGLKQSPETLGIKGENFWIYNSYDHDQIAKKAALLLEGEPQHCYLSFPSLKNPQAHAHTAEITAFAAYEPFAAFAKNPWLHRKTEYYDLKDMIIKRLLDLVEQHIRGFKGLVDYAELSTPLSIENFTSRSHGLMYGIPAVPQRYALRWLSVTTPLKNFFLSGSDVGSPGIVGALMGGIACASVLNGPLGFLKIRSAVKKDFKTRNSAIAAQKPFPPFSRKQPLSGELLAKLILRKQLAGTFYMLTFRLSETIHFVPGQHMYLQVEPAEWRRYSIVNVSGKDVTFIIDVRPGGSGSQFTLHYPVGEEILMRPPRGTFRLQKTVSRPREKIFIATGSGITPFFSMLQHLAENYQGEKIRLLWGIRDQKQDFSSEYLKEVSQKTSLEVTLCVSEPTARGSFYPGRVTERLRELQLDFADIDFYLCGNPGMIYQVHAFLRSKGALNIYFEV
jgi:phytoene dehydrogenase-like protein/ferredoxin-NADP reductase